MLQLFAKLEVSRFTRSKSQNLKIRSLNTAYIRPFLCILSSMRWNLPITVPNIKFLAWPLTISSPPVSLSFNTANTRTSSTALKAIIQGGAKNGASISHCKYSENSMTELRGNWWTSAILYAEHSHYFVLKNFIELWRHLAKTQLLCDAQIYLYNVNKRQ